eukprot:CAMPEP_0176065028 /NCGR_PEP_ID=MMETSP0120_2-20121206/32439_1 /TAXON_ID=160619 /ORGANISM="Kryptoperidinium foliaceum, Strain CCMP 1326" /LENGTH=264 /DNA_ID=CAMNT_0017398611 /DNA_START=10 /DNA_END=804 /DNA_ORIENTATION=-
MMLFRSDFSFAGACCTGPNAADAEERELAVDALVVGSEAADGMGTYNMSFSTAVAEAKLNAMSKEPEGDVEAEGAETPTGTASPGLGVASPLPSSPLPEERRGENLTKDLQEETMCSIMGYTGRPGPAPPRGPMLLGRTNLAASAGSSEVKGSADAAAGQEVINEVKDRAATARKQQRLRAFLLSSGFAEANAKKDTKAGLFRKGFTFPLHAAVAANDAAAVEVLLWGGADRARSDSQKLTPLALARQLDKQGSHRKVIALLEE